MADGKKRNNDDVAASRVLKSATIVVLPSGKESDFAMVTMGANSPLSLVVTNDQDLLTKQSGDRGPAVLRLKRGQSVSLYDGSGLFGCSEIYKTASGIAVPKLEIQMCVANTTKNAVAMEQAKLSTLNKSVCCCCCCCCCCCLVVVVVVVAVVVLLLSCCCCCRCCCC